jgi:glycerophosphoryl diester phosphodiesterase
VKCGLIFLVMNHIPSITKGEAMHRLNIFAHRGCSAVAPENTMSAFRKAIEVGADGVELDVQRSRDGKIVVIHDETVNRTTNGSGWVGNLTLAEMKSLDSGSWFSPIFADESIPTLAEVLTLLESTSMWINIELKNNTLPYVHIEAQVVRLIEYFGLQDRVILSSFNHHRLHHLHLYRPTWQLAALYKLILFEPWEYARHLGVTALHPFYRTVTAEMIRRCHQHGIAVRPYTVNELDVMVRLIQYGADAIITNVPDRLLHWLAANRLLSSK